ncbi:MAG: DUF4136 domain-containing protein [Rhodothermaceae bacterium]|nr:DUF4136 domain-containing protein [Rhodothermaceae bacterium]
MNTPLRQPPVIGAVLVALLLTLPLLIAGCGSSMRVTHGYDHTVDFTVYQTYDWLPQPDDLGDPLVDAPEIAFQIKQAVEADLERKGYRKVDRAPDFYVVTHAALRQQLTRTYIDRWGYRYPPRRWPRRGVVVDLYDVGTLVLDVIDADTDELVWRGTATDVVAGDPDEVRAQADEAVRRILAPFPPR